MIQLERSETVEPGIALGKAWTDAGVGGGDQTHVHPWLIHFEVGKNHHNIIK